MADDWTYADRRPYVVAASLRDLVGPAHGRIVLPLAVAWTGRREYDLDDPADARVLYERVIVEASDASDLQRLLDADTLRRLWSDLFLPGRVRATWEARFPELITAA